MERIQFISNRLYLYLDLSHAANLDDEAISGRLHDLRSSLNRAFGDYGVFFVDEVARMDDESFQNQVANDGRCRKLQPYLEQVRNLRPYLLEEVVEGALVKRSSFGPASWSGYFNQAKSGLRFTVDGPDGQVMTLSDLLHDLNSNQEADRRAELLTALNKGLGGEFLDLSTQTLNMVIGGKRVEDQERGYQHPMASRNLDNRVDDATVEALHKTVLEQVVPLGKRYYRLKARLLGIKQLRWSDRTATLVASTKAVKPIPFTDALELVLGSFREISPQLSDLLQEHCLSGRIDAAPRLGKQGGAFNYSVTLPDGKAVSYVLLNYHGSPRDIMTLAHELGHAAHGILAGRVQGPLQALPPMAYAETASLIGESAVFDNMLARTRSGGSREEMLALLIEALVQSGCCNNGFNRLR